MFRGVATLGEICLSYSLGLWDLIFSCPLYFFPCISSYLLLFLSYFILAVPMRKCLGKHSCKSSFPIDILNDTSFFSDSATSSAQKRIRCEMAILAQAILTLYHPLPTKLNCPFPATQADNYLNDFVVTLTVYLSTFSYETDHRKCEIAVGGSQCGLRFYKLCPPHHTGLEPRSPA